MRFYRDVCSVVATLLVMCAAAAALAVETPKVSATDAATDGSYDLRLDAARKYVESSDRYLHHSKLSRGMRGYGLTVFAGVEIGRFDVEIVSVDMGRLPGRDAILARVTGHGIETSGIASGMSGSPIFVNYNGQDRLVGALAFGYQFEKPIGFGSLCGIQPITQMLAAAGVGMQDDSTAAIEATAISPQIGNPQSADSDVFSKSLTTFAPQDYEKLLLGSVRRRLSGGMSAGIGDGFSALPLVMSASLSKRNSARMAAAMPAGMNYAAANAAGGSVTEGVLSETQKPKLQPGASLAVAMVTGDMNMVALGTVTDVVDGRVIGFGHSMFGSGKSQLPMGTGYIHTIVASTALSFKSGSLVDITGTLTGDHFAAVNGDEDHIPAMMDMSITLNRPQANSKQKFNFKVARDVDWTWLLSAMTIDDTIASMNDEPNRSYVRYAMKLKFEGFDDVEFSNMASSMDSYQVSYDLENWLWTMMNNPFKRVDPESVEIEIEILEGEKLAEIVSAATDKNTYAPGDSVKISLTLCDYYGKLHRQTLAWPLDDDLPDGDYSVALCDQPKRLLAESTNRPRFFAPRDIDELDKLLRFVTSQKKDRLYMLLTRPEMSITLDRGRIDNPPATLADCLGSSDLVFASASPDLQVRPVDMDMEIVGGSEVSFSVLSKPSDR